MVRSGISLPALQQLMGHSHIHTTVLYVQLAPQDVWLWLHREAAHSHFIASNLDSGED
jgi:site-specific recombinase XerD